MSDLARARTLLNERGYTYVLVNGDDIVCGTERGVKPLVALARSGRDFRGYAAADKTVGKAAALLYALLGVKEVYAKIMSEQAAAMCEKYGICAEYGRLVPHIINRDGTGMCPMESAVSGIDEPLAALSAVEAALEKLPRGGKP